jgi:hypothetical protein
MEYSNTFTFQSDYDPSITVVIRKPSYGDRIELDSLTEEYRANMRRIGRRNNELDRQSNPARRKFDAEKTAKLRDLKKSLGTASEEDKPDIEAQIQDAEDSQFEESLDIGEERQDLTTETLRAMAKDYNPTLIRWGLVEIKGLKIALADGTTMAVDADAAALLKAGPTHLVYEIKDRIEQALGLSGEELKNSLLPSISSDPVDGRTSDTIASAVDNPDSTKPETAASLKLAA